MAFNAPRGVRPQDMFMKRREQEAQRENFTAATQQVAHLQRLAKWEARTDSVINNRLQKERLRELTEANEQELLGRRRRLADLYNSEMEQWTREVLENVESPEDRKRRMRERALALQAAREEKRQAFVQDAYDRRWRDACDDARALDSQALLDFVAQERLSQLSEKGRRKAEEKELDEQYMAGVMGHVAALELKERGVQEALRQANAKMVADLDDQVAKNAERRSALAAARARGDQEEIARWRAELEREEARERAKRAELVAAGAAVREFNQAKAAERGRAKELERGRDLLLLEHAQRMEARGQAEEERKRAEEKRVMREYHAYLQEQMVKEAEDESAIEAHRLREENRIWDQREADLRAQADARARLMGQVKAGREEQVYLKGLAAEEERKRDQEEAMRAKIEFELMEQEAAAKQAGRRQQLADNAQRLKAQIDGNAHQRRLEEQEKYLSAKQMEMMERKHQQRLKEQAGVVETYKPLKHTQWYT